MSCPTGNFDAEGPKLNGSPWSSDEEEKKKQVQDNRIEAQVHAAMGE